MSKGTGVESDDEGESGDGEEGDRCLSCQPEVHHDMHTLGGFRIGEN